MASKRGFLFAESKRDDTMQRGGGKCARKHHHIMRADEVSMYGRLTLGWVVTLCVLTPALGDEKMKGVACRSVHLRYAAPTGTAFYNELTVDKSADGTYFVACGWSTGYFGIQELATGHKLVLFSVWD